MREPCQPVRPAWTLLLLAIFLVLALVAGPAAAKGGSFGGRRSCTATDTNGDGLVSREEQDAQCGSSEWLFFGLAVAGAGVAGVVSQVRSRRTSVVASALDNRATLTLAGELVQIEGWLEMRNQEGDPWKEYALRWRGERLWLELDEGQLTLHRAWRVQGSFEPPMILGRGVRVRERGTQRVTRKSLPASEAPRGPEPYVDGSWNGHGVCLEEAEGTLAVFRSGPATLKGTVLSVADPWVLER